MSITSTYVKQIAPQFASIDNARINLLISEAEKSIDSDIYGTRADLATAYLVAHMLTLTTSVDDGGSLGGGGGSIVTSSKVGDLARTYSESSSSGSSMAGNESLLLSTYGKELLRLQRETFTAPLLLD